MWHEDRSWCVANINDLFEFDRIQTLAAKLTSMTWTLCTGFRLGNYLFLNDSLSEDGAAEFGVIKESAGITEQVESITFGWCNFNEACRYIRMVLAGEYDLNAWDSKIRPRQIQTSAEHGRCHRCA